MTRQGIAESVRQHLAADPVLRRFYPELLRFFLARFRRTLEDWDKCFHEASPNADSAAGAHV